MGTTNQPRDRKGKYSFTPGKGKNCIPGHEDQESPVHSGSLGGDSVNTVYDTYSHLVARDDPANTWSVGGLTASSEEVGNLISTVIHATFPPEYADIIAAKHSDPERLAKVLATRTWFESRDSATNELVAVACVYGVPDAPEPTAFLGSNYVLVRGVGIGSALTDARIDWAKRNGYKFLTSSIHEWNTVSQNNMRKHGLVPIRKDPDTWTGAGDMVVMEGPVP